MATSEVNVAAAPVENSVSEPAVKDPDYRSVLEAETGYGSYESYIEATYNPGIRDSLKVVELMEELRQNQAEVFDVMPCGRCTILDIADKRASTSKISVCSNIDITDMYIFTQSIPENRKRRNAIALRLLQITMSTACQ